MGDPANFVTITGSKSIAKIVFTGGVIDNFTSVTSQTDQAYYVNLPAGQTVNIADSATSTSPGRSRSTASRPRPAGSRPHSPRPWIKVS